MVEYDGLNPVKDAEDKNEYKFHPDSAIKKFLMEISTPRLIAIINAILDTNYATDSQVSFGSTEYFTITGDLEKNSRRCDLVVDIKNINGEHDKTLIELQSTRDVTMGFRMFVYALNVSQEDVENQTYRLPEAFTIYTTLDVPEKGVDKAHFVSSKGETLFTYEAPFYNVLATEFDQFQDSPLELLKLLYLYRYRKKHNLIKNTEEFKKILDELQDYALKEEDDSDRIVICGLLYDLLVDVTEICKQEGYREELGILENLNKTYSQMMIEKGEARGEARGKAMGEAMGEAKGRLENSIEIAKNLIGKMANLDIANVTGLPLSQIEQLRANS